MFHKFKINGFPVVLDVGSGAVHAVDELTFEILEYYGSQPNERIADKLSGRRGREEVLEALSELDALKDRKMLLAEDGHLDALAELSRREPVVKALCLNVAHECNLSCRYCFAGEGGYGGEKGLMPLGVGKKAIDFLLMNSGKRRNLEVDFFGGEPTLNFDAVKGIVKYAREREAAFGKNIRFTLTTNGLLLDDEMISYINGNMSNVVLSIDGRKKINDKMRPDKAGRGSYDRIVPLFQKLVAARGGRDYYVRGTFTRENLDFCADVLHLRDLGFRRISIEPAVSEPGAEFALREEDLPAIFSEYERLAEEILTSEREGRGFGFFHFMIDLTGGPCLAKRLSGCGAGTEYLAVTPSGDLYPCHQFVGVEGFRLGNLDDGVTDLPLREKFRACGIYAREECAKCFARFYCGGGCAAAAYFSGGDINAPYRAGCEMERKRVECALYMACRRE
ncbi:MAG: thioether cross-link-forming SCIFF peptide maturase [Firmicutes bacterium]|nr:thioether cross-link-forming SCIFF peptide maturase [Bacillota bacterium]